MPLGVSMADSCWGFLSPNHSPLPLRVLLQVITMMFRDVVYASRERRANTRTISSSYEARLREEKAAILVQAQFRRLRASRFVTSAKREKQQRAVLKIQGAVRTRIVKPNRRRRLAQSSAAPGPRHQILEMEHAGGQSEYVVAALLLQTVARMFLARRRRQKLAQVSRQQHRERQQAALQRATSLLEGAEFGELFIEKGQLNN